MQQLVKIFLFIITLMGFKQAAYSYVIIDPKVFYIENILIEVSATSADKASEIAVMSARQTAFDELYKNIAQIARGQGMSYIKPPFSEIKPCIISTDVKDSFSGKSRTVYNHSGVYNVSFNPDKTISVLNKYQTVKRNEGVKAKKVHAAKVKAPYLVIPVYTTPYASISGWGSLWYQEWKKRCERENCIVIKDNVANKYGERNMWLLNLDELKKKHKIENLIISELNHESEQKFEAKVYYKYKGKIKELSSVYKTNTNPNDQDSVKKLIDSNIGLIKKNLSPKFIVTDTSNHVKELTVRANNTTMNDWIKIRRGLIKQPFIKNVFASKFTPRYIDINLTVPLSTPNADIISVLEKQLPSYNIISN